MLTKKTLLILGAGTSAPYGYPLGTDLIRKIKERLRSSDTAIIGSDLCPVNGPRANHENYPILEEFIDRLEGADPDSIDKFLQTLNYNPKLIDIGKAALTEALLVDENKEKLKNPDDPNDNWYFHLWNIMNDNCPDIENFPSDKLSIITFNYDLSFEEYFFTSMKNHFPPNLSKESIIEKMPKIIHVYGSLGELDWQSDEGRKYGIQKDWYRKKLIGISKGISTVYERLRDPKFRSDIQDALNNSEQVVFLGFGYRRENMEILGFPNKNPDSIRSYGSSYKFTKKELNLIEHTYKGITLRDLNKNWKTFMYLRETINF